MAGNVLAGNLILGMAGKKQVICNGR